MNALELMNRLRSDDISLTEFFRESESLSREELEKLASLVAEWKAEEKSQI